MSTRRDALTMIVSLAVASLLATSCGTTSRSVQVEDPPVSLFKDEDPSPSELTEVAPALSGTGPSAGLVTEDLPTPRSDAAGVVVVADVLLPVELGEEGLVATGPCGQRIVVEQQPRRDVLVVLDPVGEPGSFEVVEPIMALASERLNAAQISTAVTRAAFDDVGAPTRAAAAMASGARLLVSLGVQDVVDPPSVGYEPAVDIYHQIDSSQSRRLGGLMHESIEAALETHGVLWASGHETGVRPLLNQRGTDFYTTLRDTQQIDSVVVLLGGLTPEADSLLRSATGRSDVADALVDAIVRHFMTDDAGNGYIQPTETVRTAPIADGTSECES